jgi:hypothetical protein
VEVAYRGYMKKRLHTASRGFALIELPLVLAMLILGGLAVAGVVNLFQRPLPWYGWLSAACVLPALAAVFAGVLVGLEKLLNRSKSNDKIGS